MMNRSSQMHRAWWFFALPVIAPQVFLTHDKVWILAVIGFLQPVHGAGLVFPWSGQPETLRRLLIARELPGLRINIRGRQSSGKRPVLVL